MEDKELKKLAKDIFEKIEKENAAISLSIRFCSLATAESFGQYCASVFPNRLVVL